MHGDKLCYLLIPNFQHQIESRWNATIPHLCCLQGATSQQVSNYEWQMVYLSNTVIEEDTHIKKRLYRQP